MAGNSGGPWGGNGSGNNRPTGNNDDDRGNRRPSGQSGQVPPEVEEMLRAGQERFRVLMGGGNGGSGGSGGQGGCLLYTSPSPRDATLSRMPSSA